MTYFDSIEKAPSDPILGLTLAYREDTRDQKVNLGVGAYKNAEGNPQVLTCVRKAEQHILNQQLNKEYLPIQGDDDYIRETLSLIFGKNCDKERIFGAQTVGGTGALRIGGEFLFDQKLSTTIFLSNPSWGNHRPIFRRSGLKIDTYDYYDPQHHRLDFPGMCASIKKMPPGSTILMQPCCHNPTGVTPSLDQWKELSELIQHQKVIPFFDLAYQGFEKGLDEDAAVIRYFMDQGHEMLVASSYSKNFGLYGERVGHLAVVASNSKSAEALGTQVKQIIRGCYSMPPLQGARIVKTILGSSELRAEWEQELDTIRLRINEMRHALASGIGEQNFSFVDQQTGMFSFSGLNQDQVNRLKQEYGIYMLSNGRLSISGLNTHNMNYVIKALLSVKEPS